MNFLLVLQEGPRVLREVPGAPAEAPDVAFRGSGVVVGSGTGVRISSEGFRGLKEGPGVLAEVPGHIENVSIVSPDVTNVCGPFRCP